MSQIAFDGSEVGHPAPTGARLGPVQREVLHQLAFGSLTSTQAGTICHGFRGHCGFGVKDDHAKSHYGGTGCCRYAASDGTDVMKRLERRGYVVKIFGLWFAAKS